MKILVLGAGRMGFGAAYDLAHNSEVESIVVADLNLDQAKSVVEKVGSSRVAPAKVDASNYRKAVKAMRGYDAVISCVVYHFNEALARAAIEAGTNFCDLGGNNEVVKAELALHEKAEAAGINIVPDCGLAPGMASVLVAHGAHRFDELQTVHIRVGGLPQDPKPPLNYQIVFSLEGLINEYVEPARVIRGGKIIEVESMTELERLEFPQPFGWMEAFQTSGGTSTLPETFSGKVQDLDYKTIRYPGHCEKFKLLIDLGLASSDPIEVDGKRVSPRHVLGEALLKSLPADEPDVVLVRIGFRGKIEGENRTLRYDIIDYSDEATGLSAMMRTTAFPASIIAQMMARGDLERKGAIPQELCVPTDLFVRELNRRNIKIVENLEIRDSVEEKAES